MSGGCNCLVKATTFQTHYCQDWFHFECVGIPDTFRSIAGWWCETCFLAETGGSVELCVCGQWFQPWHELVRCKGRWVVQGTYSVTISSLFNSVSDVGSSTTPGAWAWTRRRWSHSGRRRGLHVACVRTTCNAASASHWRIDFFALFGWSVVNNSLKTCQSLAYWIVNFSFVIIGTFTMCPLISTSFRLKFIII